MQPTLTEFLLSIVVGGFGYGVLMVSLMVPAHIFGALLEWAGWTAMGPAQVEREFVALALALPVGLWLAPKVVGAVAWVLEQVLGEERRSA